MSDLQNNVASTRVFLSYARGKSVLAAALARNRQVRQAYPDGVAWIAAGQKLTDDPLLKRQRDLARHLGGDDTFASLAQGQGVLRPRIFAAVSRRHTEPARMMNRK